MVGKYLAIIVATQLKVSCMRSCYIDTHIYGKCCRKDSTARAGSQVARVVKDAKLVSPSSRVQFISHLPIRGVRTHHHIHCLDLNWHPHTSYNSWSDQSCWPCMPYNWKPRRKTRQPDTQCIPSQDSRSHRYTTCKNP